jgi:hypothetical protein
MATEAHPLSRTALTTISRRSAIDRRVLVGLAVAIWAAVVGAGRAWGLALQAQGRQITLFTPPVLGGYRHGLPDRFALPVLVSLVLVAIMPAVAARASWPTLVGGSVAGAAAWWAALAQLDTHGFTKGLEWHQEWAPQIASVSAAPGRFLSTFVDHLPAAPVQVRGHPPGLLLALGGLDRVGLAHEALVAGLVFASGTSIVVAVLESVRRVVDEPAARRVAPYLVLMPSAVWFVMSFDTLYSATTTWMVLLMLLALTTDGRRSTVLALLAGVLAAMAALLSYGTVLMAFVPLLAAVRYRRWRPVVIAGSTAAVLVLALVPFGFSWFAGLAATRHAYDTLGLDRPYDYFLVNNLSAWALAIGPAVAAGMALLRDRRTWILVGGGLAAVVLAELSGLSEGEVERIWLPFTVWVVVAAAALDPRWRSSRVFLALQASSTLALVALIETYW